MPKLLIVESSKKARIIQKQEERSRSSRSHQTDRSNQVIDPAETRIGFGSFRSL